METYDNIQQFFVRHQRTLFRLWKKDWDEGMICDFVYITEVIELPNKDVLLGIQYFDEEKPNKKSSSINYVLLSESTFAIVPSDED